MSENLAVSKLRGAFFEHTSSHKTGWEPVVVCRIGEVYEKCMEGMSGAERELIHHDPPIYVLTAYLCPSLTLQQFCRLKSTRAEGSIVPKHELIFAIAKARAVVVAGCNVQIYTYISEAVINRQKVDRRMI